jgi:hypothetical protein
MVDLHRRSMMVASIVVGLCFTMGSAIGVAAASDEAATQSEPIPLAPLTDISSLEATVSIEVDGTVDGEPTQGDLTAQLISTSLGSSRIDVTGSLLGDVVARVGGSAVKLFRPKRVSVYAVPEGTYVVLDALIDVCVKPEDAEATEVLDQLSPRVLMEALTGSDVARGTLVADEVLDGIPVKHYRIDGDESLAAAQASSDPNVSLFARSLVGATDADLYVSAEGGYPMAYRGGFRGTFEPLGFEGDLSVRIDLTGLDGESDLTLPGSCDRPIST